MKLAALLLLPPLLMVMAGCASRHSDPALSRFSDTAERQQNAADLQADEYMDCIASINQKTAVENYAEKSTRRDVVLESCREGLTRLTILQEQAYDNACRASGKNTTVCDSEAVSKTRLDTDALLQKARKQIDQTSAARQNYRQ